MPAKEVVTTPFGKFQILKGDLIGETLRAGTLWDGPGFLQPLALEYGRIGEHGVTILDVGANLGMFSVWLAARGAWRVIAVEPVPETMQMLKANLDLNQGSPAWCGDRVIPLEVAAYSHDTTLFLPPASGLDLGNLGGTTLVSYGTIGERSVPARPLDAYAHLFGHMVYQQVSLIKIDAQGCDGPALRGLQHTLERDHPVLIFEWDAALAAPHGVTRHATEQYLQGLGYDIHEWPTHPNNYVATWRP